MASLSSAVSGHKQRTAVFLQVCFALAVRQRCFVRIYVPFTPVFVCVNKAL